MKPKTGHEWQPHAGPTQTTAVKAHGLTDAPSRAAFRRLPPAAEIIRRWRSLLLDTTGDARVRTLVACSGGADSIALLLALRAATDRLVVGHVVHVLRSREEELADRDHVRALADALGLRFVEAEIHPPGRGNMEAAARSARYDALATLAIESRCPCVATGHHADDQLESVLLALLRGAGPRGLSGVAPSRLLPGGPALIRPMLGVTRHDARALCRAAGVCWRHDRTNDDTTRARAALRHGPLAELAALRPGAAGRVARTADILRDAAAVIDDRARVVFGEQSVWPRARLRAERPIILATGLRACAVRVAGVRGVDRLSARLVDQTVRAIRDERTDRREHRWPVGAGVSVRVDALEVSLLG